MNDYDFVEIGTCFFDTLIENADDTALGISIEPIKEYLDKLPNKKNVKKLNCAIVADADANEEKTIDFYYVTREDCIKHNLGVYLTGCNTVTKPHDFHTGYVLPTQLGQWHEAKDKSKFSTWNLLEMGIVKKTKVSCITFGELVDMCSIQKIDYLKTDTEGYDYKIINSVLDYYDKKRNLLPKKISFESNSHSPESEVLRLRSRLMSYGYIVDYNYHDTTARLR